MLAPCDQDIGFGDLVGVEELEIVAGDVLVGVDEYRERGNTKTRGIVAQQGTQRGGDDIGATAHGLGEDDFGGRVRQAVESVDEIGKAATEAAAGDLVGRDALGLHEVSVHQVVALIVQDDGDSYPLALQEGSGG